jgi:undecaprenyl-diphosphatase
VRRGLAGVCRRLPIDGLGRSADPPAPANAGVRPRAGLSLGEALALGALQGPTELLPVSSSGHTTLVPWLAGRPYSRLDPQLRKAFEVALHAGAGLALALSMRAELRSEIRELDRRRACVVALSLLPPALCGYAFENAIERRLGGPRSIAAGLLAGATAMLIADARAGARARVGRRDDGMPGLEQTPPEGRREHEGRGRENALSGRSREDAGPWDGLALGLAQAAALAPGVSRSGAAFTAARARGFARTDAVSLSWHAALPVIAGASALKGWRLRRARAQGSRLPPDTPRLLLVGASSAFASTLASAGALRRPALSGRSPLPWALYRGALAVAAMRRLRHERAQ